MNFDINALSNLAKLLNYLPNIGGTKAQHTQNSSRNDEKPFDMSKGGKTLEKSSFVAQNGLGEKIDIASFDAASEKTAETTSGNQSQELNNPSLGNILNILNKKSELDKMMPAFANIFSQKTKTENIENKEKSKPQDMFYPIRFAGYTTLCALNRLYFNLKN